MRSRTLHEHGRFGLGRMTGGFLLAAITLMPTRIAKQWLSATYIKIGNLLVKVLVIQQNVSFQAFKAVGHSRSALKTTR